MDAVAEQPGVDALETPCLLLDRRKMERNVARLHARLQELGAPFRPHLKTAKCIEVARRMMPSPQGPATVSTLKEAEYFAAAGVRDILYAVGLAPAKLGRIAALRRQGVDLTVILDSLEQALEVARLAQAGDVVPALIEVDCDGHRSGLPPHDPSLLAVARVLASAGALRGVLTHAGESYNAANPCALAAAAEQERQAAVAAAEALRRAGLPCPVVSVGSTPTAHFASGLEGVTEVRAGVFVFFDLVMAGIGVCRVDDIALSVLATVIGHQRDRGWILVDAGWMAMSRDRGTATQAVDQGYGIVCDVHGAPYADLIMTQANQEHGVLAVRPGSGAALPDLAVGERVRILPNHACATAAQHGGYHVLGPAGLEGYWARVSGW